MDIKLIAFVLGTAIGLISFYLYQKDIFDGPTKPHPLSWMIWLLTVTIACYGAWIGKGGYGAWYYTLYCGMILVILFKTIKRVGFENADKLDVILFVATLPAIPVVLFVSEEAGILIVVVADMIGYYFTFKKSYRDPWSEPIMPWALAIPTLVLITIAMGEYNFLTVFYSVVTAIACTILISICLARRPYVQQG